MKDKKKIILTISAIGCIVFAGGISAFIIIDSKKDASQTYENEEIVADGSETKATEKTTKSTLDTSKSTDIVASTVEELENGSTIKGSTLTTENGKPASTTESGKPSSTTGNVVVTTEATTSASTSAPTSTSTSAPASTSTSAPASTTACTTEATTSAPTTEATTEHIPVCYVHCHGCDKTFTSEDYYIHTKNIEDIVFAYFDSHPELEWTTDNMDYVYNTIAGHTPYFGSNSWYE
jgi:hypothetical protein